MLRIQEKILVHRAQRGDQNAFAKLYDEYAPHLQRFVLFKVSDTEKATELMNEIFAKIFQYLLKKEKIENFRAVLYQVARNLIIDFYRKSGHETVSLEEVSEKEVSQSVDLNAKIDLRVDLTKIGEALNTIPDRYREVIILRFIEELSFREIAKVVGESEVNVRQIASRGLKLLREKLSDWQQ